MFITPIDIIQKKGANKKVDQLIKESSNFNALVPGTRSSSRRGNVNAPQKKEEKSGKNNKRPHRNSEGSDNEDDE